MNCLDVCVNQLFINSLADPALFDLLWSAFAVDAIGELIAKSHHSVASVSERSGSDAKMHFCAVTGTLKQRLSYTSH